MKKKLLILACLVFAIGTYAVVTEIQNSILIQNVLAREDMPGNAGDPNVGGGGGGKTYKYVGQDDVEKVTICTGPGSRKCTKV